MNPFLNSVDIVKAVIRWKWHLLVVVAISMIASIVFSGPSFIKPKFKSFAIVYPSNLIAYSTESSTEQMLQMLQSSDVRQQIINSFNLMNHYELDSTKDIHAKSEVLKMYDENVTINKTEYESVQIEVWDIDPVIAASMADSIIHLGDLKIRAVQREKATEVLVIVKNQLERKKTDMDSLESLVKNYNTKYGLLDYKIQAKEISKGYTKAIISGSGKGLNEMKSQMKILTENGEEFNSLTEHLWRIRGSYNDLKVSYDIAFRDVVKELSYANVVTHPLVADKKSYPVRWLIVLISVAASFFVAFFVLLMFGSKKILND